MFSSVWSDTMSKIKNAIIIKTDDVDGDGHKDLSIFKDDEKIFTIYNLKKLGAEALATFAAVFCALVGHGLVM